MILDYYFYYFIIVTFIWVLCLCVSVYNVHAVPTESRRGRVVPSALTLNSSTLDISLQDSKPDHP